MRKIFLEIFLDGEDKSKGANGDLCFFYPKNQLSTIIPKQPASPFLVLFKSDFPFRFFPFTLALLSTLGEVHLEIGLANSMPPYAVIHTCL